MKSIINNIYMDKNMNKKNNILLKNFMKGNLNPQNALP